MKDTANILLCSVKSAVARFGLSNLSTRNIGEVSGINDALIYRYYKDKEDLLEKAYEHESSLLFDSILEYLSDIHTLPINFEQKCRLFFHKTWRLFLSDPERIIFVTRYFHSVYFDAARNHHEKQLLILVNRIGKSFPSRSACVHCSYALMSLLYDSSVRVISGLNEDTEETENQVYDLFNAIASSQIRRDN